jgi:hypothetical protein
MMAHAGEKGKACAAFGNALQLTTPAHLKIGQENPMNLVQSLNQAMRYSLRPGAAAEQARWLRVGLCVGAGASRPPTCGNFARTP